MSLIYQTIIKEKVFSDIQKIDLKKAISSCKGKTLVLTLTHYNPPRNVDQNKRHWARMEYAAEQLGYDNKEDVHEAFVNLFLTDYSGKLPKVKRSKCLTRKEFSEWEEKIDRKLSEMGIVIPETIC